MAAKIYAICALACLIFSVVSVIQRMIRWRRRTATAVGTLLRWGVFLPRPDVAFIDQHGARHLFKSASSRPFSQWPVGTQLTVKYDPDDAINAELARPNYGLPTLVTLVVVRAAFIVAALGILGFIVARMLYDQFLSFG
jgi:hypothetical protein